MAGSCGSRWPSMAGLITTGAATITGVAAAAVAGAARGIAAVDLEVAAAGHVIAAASLAIATAGPGMIREALLVKTARNPGPSLAGLIMENLEDAATASPEAARESEPTY